jgi:energy-coupling factor transporter ATP-binding protein EcfA2
MREGDPMKIDSIQLSWFRGAYVQVSLEPVGKSMVVYGANGSGKSSFVDAVEYILNNGKIGHLSHEYSGKHQEKAIPNTHRSPGQKAEVTVRFADKTHVKAEIEQDGTARTTGDGASQVGSWSYRRTVLRQDEVSAFIHDTKGEKYSALLPLLGLQQMEIAAENLRRLAKAVEDQAKVRETRATLSQVDIRRRAAFGTSSWEQVVNAVLLLYSKYFGDSGTPGDALVQCREVKAALETKITGSSVEQRRYIVLQGLAQLGLSDHVGRVRSANAELAGAVEPLVTEKLQVLESTRLFVDKLGNEREVVCPACGQLVSVEALQAHIEAERKRLREIAVVFESRKSAIGALCDALTALKGGIGKPDSKTWRDDLAKTPLRESLACLEMVSPEALRTSCSEADLKAIEDHLLPLTQAATTASLKAPSDARELSDDLRTAEVGFEVIEANRLAIAVERADDLIGFLQALEQGIRQEIRLRSTESIGEISTAIKDNWAILHPKSKITDVRLTLPDDAEKAIDICLKFYDVEQDSPRLTLSEGYRNSLGLCIFLAMANRDEDEDRPVFLDDVVVSMDRNHRGMVAELLERKFGERQVIIFTHDREWYTELRYQLDGKRWAFKTLLPYESPTLGIRWSDRTTTLDDARAHLDARPDSAGTDCRRVMDIELAIIAEKLKLTMPFVRGEKNDRRMAHDFLPLIHSHGGRCFQQEVDGTYVIRKAALADLAKTDNLLLSWANRATHTGDLVRTEAARLIESCEAALGYFKCAKCGQYVWFADAAKPELVQCQCARIRWVYGKG